MSKIDDSFGKESVEKLYKHLYNKFIKLELSENDFEKELKVINYPTKFCSNLYKLLFRQESGTSIVLNKETLSDHGIFTNKVNLLSVFLEFDEDNNGTISNDEFRKALGKQGFSSDEIVTMFAKIDEDGNGDIEFDEFIQFFEAQVAAEAEAQRVKDLETQGEVFTSQPNLDLDDAKDNLLSVRSTKASQLSSPFNDDSSSFYFAPQVKETELKSLLTKLENNEMSFSNNLDASDREILSSLIEMISNLAKDRDIYEQQINELTLNNETLTQDCDFAKTQNMRSVQEIEILKEQIHDLKQEVEQSELQNAENSRIVRAVSVHDDLDDVMGDASSNGNKNGKGKNNNANSSGINNNGQPHKKRRSSLLNDKEIKFLTDEIEKRKLLIEQMTLDYEKKENEMKTMVVNMGEIERLSKENSELQANMTKLTNKFEKDMKKTNKSNKKLKEENQRMKEYIDSLEMDMQTQKQRHSEEVTRLSIQVNNAAQNSKLMKTPGHSRQDTAVNAKRRMKTMRLDDVFDNVDGGINSLFDDGGATDNEQNANDPNFDDPFLNSGMIDDNFMNQTDQHALDDMEQNLLELETENEELHKEVDKQKRELASINIELSAAKSRIEELENEADRDRESESDGNLTARENTQTHENTVERVGDDDDGGVISTFNDDVRVRNDKMTVNDESSDDEKDENGGAMQTKKEDRIDVNPSMNNSDTTSNTASFCAWVCCGIKIV